MSSTLVVEQHFDGEFDGTEDGLASLSFASKVRICPHFYEHDGSMGGRGIRITDEEMPIVERLLAPPAPPECQADIETIRKAVARSEGCGAHMFLLV